MKLVVFLPFPLFEFALGEPGEKRRKSDVHALSEGLDALISDAKALPEKHSLKSALSKGLEIGGKCDAGMGGKCSTETRRNLNRTVISATGDLEGIPDFESVVEGVSSSERDYDCKCSGFISGGGDIPGYTGKIQMSYNEAVKACDRLEKCKGFTWDGNADVYHTRNDVDPTKISMFLKSKYDCQKDSNWFSWRKPNSSEPCPIEWSDLAGSTVFHECNEDFLHEKAWKTDTKNCEQHPCSRPVSAVPGWQNMSQIEEQFDKIMKGEVGNFTVVKVSEDPHMVMIDDFLTHEEIEQLRDWDFKWKASSTGDMYSGGTSDIRTSQTYWCSDECKSRKSARHVSEKVSRLVGVPVDNFEHMQFLRYAGGEYYRIHPDIVDMHEQMAPGPRIMTCFLYLSDVEEGGETEFPNINVKVKPKKGRAILWVNVKPQPKQGNLPHKVNHRADHTALPVKKGTKYSVNLWIRQYSIEPFFSQRGCKI